MADEPTLPQLPPFPPPPDRRKRGRDMEPPPTLSSTSSDPAFFSSDDDPALDNYQSHGRRKRRYVGAWFDQQPASSDSGVGDDTRQSFPFPRRNRGPPQPQKREFRRQLDSGVWMGTEGNLTDTDDSFDLDPVPAKFPLSSPPALRQCTASNTNMPSIPLSPARPRLTSGEQQVQNTIQSCVDRGDELVDLSDLGLETISDALLNPISEITPIPSVAKDVAFEQRDPQIKVFLSNSRLRTFPVDLLNIEHLTVLSLRGNRLLKLPPAISKLRNLQTLNIAQNFLRFLPGELLDMIKPGRKLTKLNYAPNRFWRPATASWNERGAEEYETLTFAPRSETMAIGSTWEGLTTKLQARTPVHFLDSAGKTYSHFTLPDPEPRPSNVHVLQLEPFTSLATPKELGPELRSHSATSKVVNPRGAKSLFELALGACAASAEADSIPSWLRQEEEEGWPGHFAPAIEKATELRRQGGAACSVCGRETLVPLAQWLEFRYLRLASVEQRVEGRLVRETVGEEEAWGEKPVPFLRVGCSWRCVPARVELAAVEGEERG
ncbi:hypothetical protein N658DRAFT_446569 [Parathielavia hyrcaniae]|uniref:Uncharacterized protein n=1 Tax=Parathielavia hyrcaniae TaxID=113614 RepID=A0AAN6T2R0_9PEZI|nr:hypothetical protein N658DRAFT_446569 [Parathielavia hyrcaniae]